MAVDNGRRIIDQDTTLTINPADYIIIDSSANGTRKITYENLCAAVALTLGIADISSKANGAMQKTVYDTNANGVVDNSEKLENHAANYFATAADLSSLSTTVSGKMTRSVYDSDNDGVVDNAKKANNHTVEKDVPANAVFTDTVYDDTEIRQNIGDLTALETTDQSNLVAAVNESFDEAVAARNAVEDLGLSVIDGMIQVTYE